MSLTFAMESTGPLVGAGVDAETVARFDKIARGETRPYPFVYSTREIAHCRRLMRPSEGFCAGFCCKEAVLKALEEPFRFTDCELFIRPGEEEQELVFSQELATEYGIARGVARVRFDDNGECLAVAFLFGEGRTSE